MKFFLALFSYISILGATEIKFNSLDSDLPPFIIKNNDISGVIPSILKKLSPTIKITYISVPRKRVDDSLKFKQIDASLLTPQWTKLNKDLIFIPLGIDYTNYIFTLKSGNNNPTSMKQVQGAKVCTRRGYIYPGLRKEGSSLKIKRIDSNSEKIMLELLSRGRCSYLIGNKHVINYHIKKNKLSQKIKRTNLVTSEVQLQIAVRKEKSKFIAKLRSLIQKMIEKNEIESLIQSFMN